jgi:zinc protease
LGNGLTVVLAPVPAAPTASVWVWYRVGSKNERPGITGASHWVEHMLFEGSPRFPKGAIDLAVTELGGELNAFTDTDFTAYFTTVPREHLKIPLSIEADRMTRALLLDREVERERTVIHSEREGAENLPEFRVEEELYQLAFRHHPYRWDALGRRADIERISPAELREYYHRFYGPKNAVLVVAGGFDPVRTARDVRRSFGRLPSSGADIAVPVVEPLPEGERRGRLSGPGTTPLLRIGWPAPALEDPAAPATMMVDAILGGETRLFSVGPGWGGSGEHPSARLYRALVDPGLAIHASSEYRPRVFPGLFGIHAQAARGVGLDRLEQTVGRVVSEFVRSGPDSSELAAARVRIRRAARLGYEGATRIGFRLGYFEATAPPGFEDRLLRRLLAVNRAEVRDRARQMFLDTRRTVVRFDPTPEANGG